MLFLNYSRVKLENIMPLYLGILKHIFPKNKNILFHEYSTTIKTKKFNMDTILLSKPQFIFPFH